MDALDISSPSENRPGAPTARRSRRVQQGPVALPAVGQSRSLASGTNRDQDSVNPKVQDFVIPEISHGALGNSGSAKPQEDENVSQRSARLSQRGRRSAPAVAERFWLLNRWQGQVLKVGRETFEAQLSDPAHPSVIEHAEFSISELPPDGLALLRPGAIFYWMIGYRDLSTRQRRRESVIWMRRSGRMGQDKFQATLDHVEAIWTDLVSDADAVEVSQRERVGEEHRTLLAEPGRYLLEGQQGTILLVEDEERERAVNAHGLASRGYCVIEASNLNEAMTKLEQQGRDVDVVVLDVVMPDMDGATLLKQFRQVTRDVGVVMISSTDDDVFMRLAKGERPNILQRPFGLEELITVVHQAMPVRPSALRGD
jgi:CheY-like chemotaxis protein